MCHPENSTRDACRQCGKCSRLEETLKENLKELTADRPHRQEEEQRHAA